MPFDSSFFNASYPWDPGAQQRTHGAGWVNSALQDRAGPMQQQLLIEADLYTGVEGFDYQNPYAFQSQNLLTVATLDASYGILGDSPQSVVQNILRNSGSLKD